MRSQRENRFVQAQVFVGFCRNLVIAAGGLQQKKGIGFGGILQRSAIGKSGQEMDQILDSELFDMLLKFSFRAARPKVDRNSIGADLAFGLQLCQRTEERNRVPLPGINQSGMQ